MQNVQLWDRNVNCGEQKLEMVQQWMGQGWLLFTAGFGALARLS